MAKSKKVEARERARAAKARVDARRAARDEQISEAQTAYYIAVADRDVALESVATAEQDMALSVSKLKDTLGVRPEEIAELCEITQAEVRALSKRGRQSTPSGTETAAEPAGEAPAESDVA
ncbi:hypothetical protein GCM10022199_27650 [Marihabitans asiaticum]|uniref:Uncharacterized protein n=1 Tax=Marihabitans asiaticum TaxID=415218 RepID=A0A560W609_9MICO|nr:hypothetical protein [Marihabitans asiaticum]TWD13062.1 hypothetical protein FB557_2829 [Marihabitans asiaticum]